MRYQRISIEDKQRLVNAHNRGEDYIQLARQLNIKPTTAYAIIRRSIDNNGIVARPRGGVRPQRLRVSPTLRDAAVAIVEHHAEFTLDQINTELQTSLPNHARISRSTLSNMLHGELIVLKKLEDAPIQRNSVIIKQSRQEFAQWIMQNMEKELIFIDEAGINLWTKRTRGRARVGERAIRVVGGVRGRNFTMTFAASATRGLLYHQLTRAGMNIDRFNEFLTNLANHLPEDGMERIFLFDNAPSHRGAGQVEFPESKNIRLRWLPPYSPMLNIVEQCFAQWKAALKQHLAEVREQINQQSNTEREATLCQLAEQNVNVITPQNCVHYFRHLQRYLPQCLLQHDIFM